MFVVESASYIGPSGELAGALHCGGGAFGGPNRVSAISGTLSDFHWVG